MAGDADAVAATPPDMVARSDESRPGLSLGRRPRRAQAVELLVAAGLDVNSQGRSDVAGNQPWHTALHVAAEKDDLVLARKLLELGPTPTSPTSTTSRPPWAGPATSTDPQSLTCSNR